MSTDLVPRNTPKDIKKRKTLVKGNARRPWHKQNTETAKAYHAFCHYFALPLGKRTALRAFKDHLVDCGAKFRQEPHELTQAPYSWKRWCADNNWIERAELHDEHIEIQAQKRWRQMLINERDQQYKMAVAVRSKVAQRLSSMDIDELPATALASLLKVSSEMALTALGHDKRQTTEIELKPQSPMVIEHVFSRRDPLASQDDAIEEADYEVIDSERNE